jgi:hypothetical protein
LILRLAFFFGDFGPRSGAGTCMAGGELAQALEGPAKLVSYSEDFHSQPSQTTPNPTSPHYADRRTISMDTAHAIERIVRYDLAVAAFT